MQFLKQAIGAGRPVVLKAGVSVNQQQHVAGTVGARQVEAVIDELHTIEGPGFEICRPFPTSSVRNFDPWILFDAFGPKVTHPGDKLNQRMSHLGQHPHRGFEAISYFVQGSYDHYDSTGKHGRMEAGSVQLMTAGGGIVHGGAPSSHMIQHGGRIHGYQLWLALPAAERMCAARTLDFNADATPVVTSPDGRVTARVIASPTPVYGVTCDVVPTRQPITLVHYTLQPGARVSHTLPANYRVMVHVSMGAGVFGPNLDTPARAEQCVFFQNPKPQRLTSSSDKAQALAQASMTTVDFACPEDALEPLDVLLLGGLPTGDKIVQHGPFVGGSMEDIQAANTDFRAGLMGELKPDGTPRARSMWAA